MLISLQKNFLGQVHQFSTEIEWIIQSNGAREREILDQQTYVFTEYDASRKENKKLQEDNEKLQEQIEHLKKAIKKDSPAFYDIAEAFEVVNQERDDLLKRMQKAHQERADLLKQMQKLVDEIVLLRKQRD